MCSYFLKINPNIITGIYMTQINNIDYSKDRLFIVAYLDLLNQEEKIIKMDKLDLTKEQDRKKFEQLFNETYGTVKRFKESIFNTIDNYCNKLIDDKPDSPVTNSKLYSRWH